MVFISQDLCPENFTHFKNKIVIKKLDVRKYEKTLKEEFTNWIKNGNEEQVFSRILGKALYFFFLSCVIQPVIPYLCFAVFIVCFRLLSLTCSAAIPTRIKKRKEFL